MEFRGLHDDEDDNQEEKYFEFGAHFRYKDLVEALKYLQDSQISKNEKERDNCININSNSNYNEVYNQINGTQIQKTVSGEVSVEILSSENNELLLSLDLTNLYKNLDYDYEQVIYKIKFYNINGISLAVEESSSGDSTSGLLSKIYEELKKEEEKKNNI